MKPYSVYLLETGCPAEPPVFPKGASELAVSLLGPLLLLRFRRRQSRRRAAGQRAGGRGKPVSRPAGAGFRPLPARRCPPAGGRPGRPAGAAGRDPAERVLLYPLSQVFLADPAGPAPAAGAPGGRGDPPLRGPHGHGPVPGPPQDPAAAAQGGTAGAADLGGSLNRLLAGALRADRGPARAGPLPEQPDADVRRQPLALRPAGLQRAGEPVRPPEPRAHARRGNPHRARRHGQELLPGRGHRGRRLRGGLGPVPRRQRARGAVVYQSI